MRIVLVNWARIEQGPLHGGGVNGYCQAIARELVHRGDEVISISSGTRYARGPDGRAPGPCSILERCLWERIRCFDVVNSPVLAPSMAQFREPIGEVSAPELESAFLSWLGEVRPDVVHFHNIEGFSAGCVLAARHRSARVLYTLHNYHTICPQVYLMQGHRRPCHWFDHGHACSGCITTIDPAQERARLATSPASASEPPPVRPHPIPPPPWETLELPAWRPLLNIITPEPESAKSPNDYARRRAAMVDMLNSCHQVLAVSDFVRRKFEALGVAPSVIRHMSIGSPLIESTVSRRGRAVGDSGPIRLAFMGYNNWFKGLPLLLDSLELLTPEYLGRIDLRVLGLNLAVSEPHLRRLEPRLAALRMVPGYSPDDLPRLLADVELGIVPSVWWDNAPQTVMEFLACGVPVLAAELGGIPEFVRDGRNGLLFRGNDRWDLARQLAGVVQRPERLVELAREAKPLKSISQHAAELQLAYRNRLS